MQSLAANRKFLAGLLVALTLVAYGPTLAAGFIWDDDDYVTENPTLRTADGLRQIWLDYGATPQYYPMVHTSYWLEGRSRLPAPARSFINFDDYYCRIDTIIV